MSAYRFDVEYVGEFGKRHQSEIPLDAIDRDDAEYEAEYVFNMFPSRHYDQTGRLYADGVLVREMTWTAVPW